MSREVPFRFRQASPALSQAAALQRAAGGERLQVPGHLSLEAGRLHPHRAVPLVLREQLAEPRGDGGAAKRSERDRAADSKLVLLSAWAASSAAAWASSTASGRRRKRESTRMAQAIRYFVNTFIHFKKPLVVAVNGPGFGLGASILPLCDVVWANEKAWFQTPYTTFGQSPDGCSTVMFP